MKYFWCTAALLVHIVLAKRRAFYTKLLQHPQENYNCLIIEQNSVRIFKGFETSDANEFKTFIRPAISAPSEMKLKINDSTKLVEVYAKTETVLEAYTNAICKSKEVAASSSSRKRQTLENPEVVKIIDGGDQANRIDVVFMGDGYTVDERDNFFSDIRRLTDDMFNGETFRSYLPLFNIWAIYVESSESGIGYNGYKDTAFRLYRSAGQLRGIFTANAQYAREVCRRVSLRLDIEMNFLCFPDLPTHRAWWLRLSVFNSERRLLRGPRRSVRYFNEIESDGYGSSASRNGPQFRCRWRRVRRRILLLWCKFGTLTTSRSRQMGTLAQWWWKHSRRTSNLQTA